MAGELRLGEVAAPTAPAAGKHNLFISNETLPRLRRQDAAGTVYPSADIFMIAQAANRTLSNVNTAQAVFDATTNGAITLPGASSYILEANYTITNTGTTAHTWAVLFGGTATLTSGRFTVVSLSSTSAAASASALMGHSTALGTAFVVTASSTSATENVNIVINGVVRINAGGTFIPQVQLSAATGAAALVLANSWVRLTPFGSNTATNLGNWS